LPDKIIPVDRIRPWALAALSCLCLLIAPSSSPYASTLSDSLATEANEKELHQSRQWHALMHYRPGLLSGHESVVDDPSFFLSPEGKTSPLKELRATINALFNSPASEGDAHPACRFPARHEWLRRELSIPDLPAPECADLRRYMKKLSPVTAALVFPESHINSPASMFGHTLIRMDSARESRLLSYSISYAADLPEDPGPLYALKGVTGAYKGNFSIMPYYEKLKEYSHMESRDIWEYGLDLTPAEVRRMALHTWELRTAYSDYYFFDDNCSYILLFLIEAARPQADLTGGFFYWVLPTDTIRALRREGLINSSSYRPSKATRIAHMESIATGPVLETALAVGSGGLAASEVMESDALRESEKALALDLAAEYTLHQYMAGALDPDSYSARYLSALSARSTLESSKYHIPSPSPPDSGHGTARLTLGAGRRGQEDYALLRFRVAYHGLMDPSSGYSPGSSMEILAAEARYIDDTGQTLIERFKLIEITSLWPGGNFIRPLSWHMLLGAERERAPGGERTPLKLEGGLGMTAAMGQAGLGWFMLEPSLKAGGGLMDNYALGGGLTVGAVIDIKGTYRLMLSGRAFYYPAGERHSSRSLLLRQNVRLSQNLSLSLDYSRSRLDGLYESDTSLALQIYF
jgi:hypothetical protein